MSDSASTTAFIDPSTLTLRSLFDVQGKVVLITGGGTGLGAYQATAFAINGAKVYITGRRENKLQTLATEYEQKKGASTGTIIPLVGDISSKESIEKLVTDFGELEPGLDVLINCAGIVRYPPLWAEPDDVENVQKALWSHRWEDWTKSYEINVNAVYFTTVAFIPHLRKAPAGDPSVLNITSIAGYHISRGGANSSYQTSKAAANYLTENLASRLLTYKIRVNGIAPGLFPSEMSNPDPETLAKTNPGVKGIPKGECRPGTPEDIAGPSLMLASRAGTYINGQMICVDGGRLMTLSATAF